jgi:hypothetical protein
MYAERLKLLLGHYDVHKKTKRLLSSNSILEIVARKLAFYLHSKNKRSAALISLEDAAVFILRKQSQNFAESQVRTAVRELVDPCNILVPMTEDGEFGFDHLRYQEHLAATELSQNRGIDLRPMLTSLWWRSVLVLFARMTDEIQYIFAEVLEKESEILKYHGTLLAMASTKNSSEQRYLKGLLADHSKLDLLGSSLKEFYEYDNDSWGDAVDAS